MAVDKNAVREGARLIFRGSEVVVADVGSNYVVHSLAGDLTCSLDVTLLEYFLHDAHRPNVETYREHVEHVHKCIRLNAPRRDVGLETLAYLLDRVGPPAP